MNREIKFRGKAISGQWVYGNLMVTKNRGTFIKSNDDDKIFGSGIEVHPETVGQYTGLKDKDGNEIYENDCFQIAGNKVYQIRYHEGVSNHEWYGGTFLLFFNDFTFFPFDEYAMKNGVVIGNIHDNSELINK